MNLALSLGRQRDLRTVLLDVDFRRPSLARMTGGGQNNPLDACLMGEQTFEDCAWRVGENLAFGGNQRAASDVDAVLNSRSLPLALSGLEETYAPDFVILDTPPMMVTHDVLALAEHVDCVLIIAAAEKTTAREIDICERDLATLTNVMGVVLNKCHHVHKGYGSYR